MFNYLLTYDSYGPVHNRFHSGECITWASGGEWALDTPGPLNGSERSPVDNAHSGTLIKQENSFSIFKGE